MIYSFECGSTYKLTIALKRYNLKALQDSILMPMHGDSMDKFREESNKRFMDEAVGAGNFQHIRYLIQCHFVLLGRHNKEYCKQ